jgi:hypothetical protein
MADFCNAECHLRRVKFMTNVKWAFMLNVFMLSVIMLGVIMLSGIMLSVIMLSIVVPTQHKDRFLLSRVSFMPSVICDKCRKIGL